MLGFEQTPTGYRATDEQVAWWAARDTCPSCHAVVSPVRVDPDGAKHYEHDCNGLVEWGAYSPADTAGLGDDWRPVGLTVATIHMKWLDLGLPARTWPAFLARYHVEHDMTERAMSDCKFGCKVFKCECGEREVRHMASYGCPTGRAAN